MWFHRVRAKPAEMTGQEEGTGEARSPVLVVCLEGDLRQLFGIP